MEAMAMGDHQDVPVPELTEEANTVNHSKHLTYMIMIGVAVLAVLTLTGTPLTTALPYALALACPLMMVFMMAGMKHGPSGAGQTSVSPAQVRPQEATDTSSTRQDHDA